MRLAILELKVAVVKVLSAFRIEATSETPKPVSRSQFCETRNTFLRISLRKYITTKLKFTLANGQWAFLNFKILC